MIEKKIFSGQPNPDHAPKWANDSYFKYVVKYDNLLFALEENRHDFINFLKSIPEDKWNYRYGENKWTLKGVVSHVLDTERIFQYRALRHSRHDETDLPGFDENAYEQYSNLDNRSVDDLIHEFDIVRLATNILYDGMGEKNLDFVGKANGQPFSARSAGWIMVGHVMHHEKIIKERYL
jgi:uncharacterized damage-inducible protein DinB|tara:strand:- start:3743 stop:4279 length:537 start_codon:yes stop_codon:yes gene_type:complete